METLLDTPERTRTRKGDHIDLCMRHDVESLVDPFAEWRLRPTSLPEMTLNDIDTSCSLLGTIKPFAMPLIISGMTGGTPEAHDINRVLAAAAATAQIPMGLGSLKLLVRDPTTHQYFHLKSALPQLFLVGNLGVVSLNTEVSTDQVVRLVETLELDAFALHLNAAQEAIQPEGERDFSNGIKNISLLVEKLPVPVIVKEVGAGIGGADLRRLIDAGVTAVDVAGSGGSSWPFIEGLRRESGTLTHRLGSLFRHWGLPTGEALCECAQVRAEKGVPVTLIASGGIRNGIHAAITLALGADAVGAALPFLRAAQAGESLQCRIERVREELEFFRHALRIAMFCSGARTIADLRGRAERREPTVVTKNQQRS